MNKVDFNFKISPDTSDTYDYIGLKFTPLIHFLFIFSVGYIIICQPSPKFSLLLEDVISVVEYCIQIHM